MEAEIHFYDLYIYGGSGGVIDNLELQAFVVLKRTYILVCVGLDYADDGGL